jgi:membrane associated rhomboid family serine protease
MWTLATSLFLHANLIHLIGNVIFLYVFGNTLEKIRSAGSMSTVFFFGGIVTFLLSTFFFEPGTPLVGASAAIFTLTAVVMLMKPLRWSWLLLMPVGLAAILYFLYNLAAIYYGIQSEVAYIAHVIGFALGIPFGIAWTREWFRNLIVTIALLLLYFLLVLMLRILLGVELPLLGA